MIIFIGALLTVLLIAIILIFYFIYYIFSNINNINNNINNMNKSLSKDREIFIKLCDNATDIINDNKTIIETNKELINKMGDYMYNTIKNIYFIKQNMIRRKKPIND